MSLRWRSLLASDRGVKRQSIRVSTARGTGVKADEETYAVFCCARVLIPGMESEPDRIMPQMAIELTRNVGMGWMAGLLIAAPFAAVMSTVDSFLLMISSAFVRDIYQRKYPQANEEKIRKVTYLTTIILGIAAMAAAINPPQFLEDLIIFTGGGVQYQQLVPMVACTDGSSTI